MQSEQKIRWLGMTLPEMETAMQQMGEKPFRARQLCSWIYGKGASDFAEMTDFSLSFREKLAEVSEIGLPVVEEYHQSTQDPVKKALMTLWDHEMIESVLMKYNYGNSVCVSTQAGCKMNCRFCATGLNGFRRNLSAGEMLGQVLVMRDLDGGDRISHLALMGMGEPLDNFDQVLRFLQIANASWGLGIGYRHITVSTCGITPQIERLMQEDLPINLSISLHAPNDTIRQHLMPIAKHYPLDELLAACKLYSDTTKRRITFEYNLIDSINDKPEHARELVQKMRNMLCHVNLIPLNTVPESNLYRSKPDNTQAFADLLKQMGIEVTLRREMGSDIFAACGQLRGQHQIRKGTRK